MKAAICLCLLAFVSLCDAQDEAAAASARLDDGARAAIIENTLHHLEDGYVFPDIAAQTAQLIRTRRAAGAYEAITQPEALATQLTRALREISHDRHLGVLYEPPTRRPVEPAPRGDPARPFNHGFERVERLDGNIGYLDLRGFMQAPGTEETCAAAMRLLADTDALIIDLRNNGGGSPGIVTLLASYFFAERTHFTGFYDRIADATIELWTHETVRGPRYARDKRLYVLVSRGTFSAAEDFAYSMQMRRRATIIGEVTGGGAHPVAPRSIGPGLMLMLPIARSINPISGTNWEGVGVQPDVQVPALEALHVAHGALLRELASSSSSPRLATLMHQYIAANTAALDDLRQLHAADAKLWRATLEGEPRQLRASPAGRVAAEFLAVLNIGNLGALARFRARHSKNLMRNAEDYALYLRSGGFKVHSIAAQEDGRVVLLAQRRRDNAWQQLDFTVDDAAPHPILGFEVRTAAAP